ncbi:MAG: hypothetical protein ACOVSW_19975 [Candidatus Kapaibacteriota bacterium]
MKQRKNLPQKYTNIGTHTTSVRRLAFRQSYFTTRITMTLPGIPTPSVMRSIVRPTHCNPLG